MSAFLADYGLFLLKTVTLVAAIVVVVGTVAATSRKSSQEEGLTVEHLNEKQRKIANGLRGGAGKRGVEGSVTQDQGGEETESKSERDAARRS